jgi:hypothetical protein
MKSFKKLLKLRWQTFLPAAENFAGLAGHFRQ